MRRLFVAVDLSIAVVERIAMLQNELRAEIGERFDDVRLRTVDAPNIHLTLKFLGDTPPALVPRITEALSELCEPLFPFDIECLGVGAFPSVQSPRVLWVGLDDQGAEVLELLQRHVERDLHELGIEKDRREYHPHVTVARVKSGSPPSLESLLKEYGDVGFGQSFITDIVLYESHLGADGARYDVVERFSLRER